MLERISIRVGHNGTHHRKWLTGCGASDARLKKDVVSLNGMLAQIEKLRPVRFRWKDDTRGKGEQLGLIAQEVEQVFPQLVVADAKGIKSINYQLLVSPIIDAMKELKAENDNQAAEVKRLRADVDALRSICKTAK